MSVKILAIDTATENCSVALLVGDTIYSRSEVAPRDHTKKVLPMVEAVLAEAKLELNQLDALAYGQGPGSFTGVRIGIGIAQGLAFGADLPMIGVSTLKAMAQACYRLQGVTQVATAIDARMSEVYWAQYQRMENGDWQVCGAETVIAPERLKDQMSADDTSWHKAGTGWQAYPLLDTLPLGLIDTDVVLPQAQDMAVLAARDWQQGLTTDAEHASPIYLRDTVAWKKLPGRE